jgi:hypothetical protein
VKTRTNALALLMNDNGVSRTSENDRAGQPSGSGANNINRFRPINLPGLCVRAHHHFGHF